MNKDTECLKMYKKLLEKELSKAEVKLQKQTERKITKLRELIADYPSIKDIDEAYGVGAITEAKREKLYKIHENIEEEEKLDTALGRYVYMLRRNVKNLETEIAYPRDEEMPVAEPIQEKKGIPINEKYRLKSEELNVMVEQKKISKNGNEHWKVISYHPNLEMALKSLIDKEINETELINIKDVVNKIKELKKYVENRDNFQWYR